VDTRYRKVAEVEAAPMLEETLLYHPGKQSFCVLNPTAAFLWERLEAPLSAAELASAVMSGFAGVALDDAHRDVASVLKDLHELELVETLSVEDPNAARA